MSNLGKWTATIYFLLHTWCTESDHTAGLFFFAENTTKGNIYLEILELSAFLQTDDSMKMYWLKIECTAMVSKSEQLPEDGQV
jgi:hypothetical protein